MAIREDGREATTHYRVIQRFRGHTHVRLQLETGRTHQIRVHMAHIRYPLVGDRVYGGRLLLPKGASAELIEMLQGFKRQALHAARLAFAHPVSGKPIECVAALPADMRELLAVLARDAGVKVQAVVGSDKVIVKKVAVEEATATAPATTPAPAKAKGKANTVNAKDMTKVAVNSKAAAKATAKVAAKPTAEVKAKVGAKPKPKAKVKATAKVAVKPKAKAAAKLKVKPKAKARVKAKAKK
jgi:hypothetical protein